MTDDAVTADPAEGEAPDGWVKARLIAVREAPIAHGVLLGLFSLCTALILSLVDDLTRGPIADRVTEDLNSSLAQVIPDGLHDNAVTEGVLTIEDPQEGPVAVYQARQDGQVTAVAFEMTAYGYGGRIQVLLGVDAAGQILGVRVLSHAETPGLGDKIEVAKSDWILGFEGRSLTDPQPDGWKVKRDGGVFDQFSGATITPRAVVGAIRRGLDLFERNRAALLTAPDPAPKEAS